MKNILLGGLAIVSAIFSMDCRAAALSNGKSQCDAGVEICTIVIYAFPADLKHTRCYIKAAFEETDASAATKGFSWHLVDAVDDQFKYEFFKQGAKKAIELKSNEEDILSYNDILKDSGNRMHWAHLKQINAPFCTNYDVHVRQITASGETKECDGSDPVIANNRISSNSPSLSACPQP